MNIRLLTLSLVAVFALVAAQEESVTVVLEAYLVTTVTNEDGEVEEVFTEATEAKPGQTVEYRVVVGNDSDDTLPAGTVVVTGPVPGTTFYLTDTAAQEPDSFKTEFSADGGESFSELPVMITVTNEDGVEEEVAADPASFSAVRWTLLDALAPESAHTFTYRVEVK